MEYKGIDYVNKTPDENANIVFDCICVGLVKRNKLLFEQAIKISQKHADIMITETSDSDKKRGALLSLKPTWIAIKKELGNIKMLTS